MMIWDIIREWFVVNIWGGNLVNGESYYPYWGHTLNDVTGADADIFGNDLYFKLGNALNFNGDYEGSLYISVGDWLSTTSTIIVLVAVSVGLFFLTRYFFRMFAGLLSGR